jgi:hypothetical protein
MSCIRHIPALAASCLLAQDSRNDSHMISSNDCMAHYLHALQSHSQIPHQLHAGGAACAIGIGIKALARLLIVHTVAQHMRWSQQSLATFACVLDPHVRLRVPSSAAYHAQQRCHCCRGGVAGTISRLRSGSFHGRWCSNAGRGRPANVRRLKPHHEGSLLAFVMGTCVGWSSVDAICTIDCRIV